MQCNVNGDDEALSLTTIKETEWLNHMRQNVEDHQHRQIHVRICYDRWVFATVANTHFSIYGYLLP